MEHRGPMIGHSLSRHVIEIGSDRTGPGPKEGADWHRRAGRRKFSQPTGEFPEIHPEKGLIPGKHAGIRGVVIIGWCSAQVSRSTTLGRNAARRRRNNGRDAELRMSPPPAGRRAGEGGPNPADRSPRDGPGARRAGRPKADPLGSVARSGATDGLRCHRCLARCCHEVPCQRCGPRTEPAVGWRQPLSLRCSAARRAPRARSTGRPEAVPRTSGSARGSAGPPASTPRRPP